MSLTVQSPCKINLILNVLPRRSDGFHELESLFLPVPLHDEISIEKSSKGIELNCSNPALSPGPENLVHRAASAFFTELGEGGARIQLQKKLPIAAGIGAGCRCGYCGATLVLDEAEGAVEGFGRGAV